MALEMNSWDAAEILRDAETVFYFIEASLEDATPEHVAGSLATAARARGGLEAFALQAGMEAASMQEAINHPSEFTYQVARAVMRKMRPSSTVLVA